MTLDELGDLYGSVLGLGARRAPLDQPLWLVGDDDPVALTSEQWARLTMAERALLGAGRVVSPPGRRIPPGGWYVRKLSAERKGAGAFYTGDPLAGPTVRRALAPFVRRSRGNESLRLVDPAMGCGAFLLAALRHLSAARGWTAAQRGAFLRRSVFGFDVDALAVEATRLALWIEAGDRALPLADLAQNLCVGDGLCRGRDGSFDVVLGNPPWEISKPNSREFFAAHDPLYRRLDRQAALERRQRLLRDDPRLALRWLRYQQRHRAFSRRVRRDGRFRLQGRGDINLYKLFLERALQLLKPGGRLALILPSGIASDLGGAALRSHLLARCRWEWLYMFENRDAIFPIHRSYKFGAVVVRKGGRTRVVRSAFMRRDLGDWGGPGKDAFPYPRPLVERFSPGAVAFLEIRHGGELGLLEKIFANSVRVGDLGDLTYRREFDLTNDRQLFLDPEDLLRRGWRRDALGRFTRGPDEVALPLYQGAMVRSFDCAAAAHEAGGESRGHWRELTFRQKQVRPRFAVDRSRVRERSIRALLPRLAFRDVQNACNERTLLATLVPGFPCGNTLPTLSFGDPLRDLALLPVLASFPLDRVVRLKMSQNHVNRFLLRELPLPANVFPALEEALLLPAARLALHGPWFAREWLRLARRFPLERHPWQWWFALTSAERLRLRCILDAVVAHMYGLQLDDLRFLLEDCHLPRSRLASTAGRRALDPKGFWRVGRDRPPELRHTVLTLAAFRELSRCLRRGSDAVRSMRRFCGVGASGWQLPETLVLAELIPGAPPEQRAVASRLGPRRWSWQEEATPRESWRECARLAGSAMDGALTPVG